MSKGNIGAFLLGGAVGAIIALLVAPRSGTETRVLVGERLNSAWSGAQDFGAQTGAQAQQVYQNVASRGQKFAQTAASCGQSLMQNAVAGVQKAADSVKTVAQPVDSDELRDKIEAARQRIASQVMRNATESRAAVDDEIDVVAEPVSSEDDSESESTESQD